jgi:thioredoxin 1
MQDTKNNSVLKLTTETFSDTIKSGITLVDFWAEWCGPCRMQGPIVDNVAAKTRNNVNISKLNVDENPEIAQKYNISGIPTILIFKDGTEVKRLVGVQSENFLNDTIDTLV